MPPSSSQPDSGRTAVAVPSLLLLLVDEWRWLFAFGLVWLLVFLAFSKSQPHLQWMEISLHCGFSEACGPVLRVVLREEIPVVFSSNS